MILNLTLHLASQEQREAGVVDLTPEERAHLAVLLTFELLPQAEDVREQARAIAHLAQAAGASQAMIGGAPWLMAPLERELRERGVAPLYAFSVRDRREETLPDGTVRTVAVFRHRGFVRAVGDLP